MNRIIFSSLIMIVFLSSCKEEILKAIAYGNFETNTIIVSSQAKGQLLYLNVEEGQKIALNEWVGLVDTLQLDLQKQLIVSQQKSINSKTVDPNAEIKVLLSQLKNIQREKQRVEKLVNAKAATSKQLDDINGEIVVVNQKIEAARENAKVANRGILSQRDPYNAQVNIINAQIKDSYIHNPIEGIVINKLSEPSEIVGYGTPLYTIADMSSLTLRAYTDAVSLQSVRVGDEVVVKVDGQNGEMQAYEGIVSWIATEAEFTPKIIQTKKERVNLVYALKIEVENNGNLKIGMPAEVDFQKSNSDETEG